MFSEADRERTEREDERVRENERWREGGRETERDRDREGKRGIKRDKNKQRRSHGEKGERENKQNLHYFLSQLWHVCWRQER